MSCIVYQTNKKTGITYAYESFSYWDKEKKQPRSKRKYIGRVDSDTGEIVTTRKRRSDAGESSDSIDEYIAQLKQTVREQRNQITLLNKELEALTRKYEKAVKLIGNIASLSTAFEE